jgi:hypothetical protein
MRAHNFLAGRKAAEEFIERRVDKERAAPDEVLPRPKLLGCNCLARIGVTWGSGTLCNLSLENPFLFLLTSIPECRKEIISTLT